jgi:hypothetical protein
MDFIVISSQNLGVDFPYDTSQIEIVIGTNFPELTPNLQLAIVGALAGILNIPRDQVRVLGVRTGSVIFRLEMPTEAANRLMTLHESGDPSLQHLRVERVKVIQDNLPPTSKATIS